MTETKKESKMRKQKQKRTNNRKKKKNRKEEREEVRKGKWRNAYHIGESIQVRVSVYLVIICKQLF